MAANIEFKARLQDVASAHAIAKRLSGKGQEILRQCDVFFASPRGRLKLRIFDEDEAAAARGELILYERSDQPGPRRSNYQIASTPDPLVLRQILEQMLGSFGTVRKVRSLYLAGQSRIHLDKVEGLGDFLEIEVVLREGQPDAEGEQIAQFLMQEFGIQECDLVPLAYIDLLSAGQK